MCLLQERHSINFIEEYLRYILSNISDKLCRQQIDLFALTPEEQELWKSFDIGDITFFLSGHRECTPDCTRYLWVSSHPNPAALPQPVIGLPHPTPPPQPIVAQLGPPALPNPRVPTHIPCGLVIPPGFILTPNPPIRHLAPSPAPHPPVAGPSKTSLADKVSHGQT